MLDRRGGGQPDPPGEDDSRTLAETLGRVGTSVGVFLRTEDEVGGDELEALYARGILEATANCADTADFVRALRRVRTFYLQDAQKLLTRLVEARSWLRCELYLRRMQPRENQPIAYRLRAAVAACLVNDGELSRKWVAPLVAHRASTIEGSVTDVPGNSFSLDTEVQQISVMASAAFVLGFEAPYQDASTILQEFEARYRETRRDDRRDAAVSHVTYAAAALGSFVATMVAGKPRAQHLLPSTVAAIVETLRSEGGKSLPLVPVGFGDVAALICSGLLDCAVRDLEVAPVLCESLIASMQQGAEPDRFLDPVWKMLDAMRQRLALTAYAESLIGKGGTAWREAVADDTKPSRASPACLMKSESTKARLLGARDWRG